MILLQYYEEDVMPEEWYSGEILLPCLPMVWEKTAASKRPEACKYDSD